MFGEFRFAARSLARWRGGAVVAALTLAAGIGATTGLYGLVRVMLADLPGVPDLARLGRIYAASPSLGVERAAVALTEFDSTLSRATSFSAIGVYAEADATIGAATEARPIVAAYASPGFFDALSVQPVAGRLFTSGDLAASRPVAILSHALWRRHFAERGLTDASVIVDGTERAVIGVMPPEFSFSFVGIAADLWIPLGPVSQAGPAIVSVFARLRPDAGWPAAAAELNGMARGREPWTWRAIPVQTDTRQRARAAYAITLGPALLVLLIACVNVGCMLMARGLERDRELSVRRALGATRARVIRLLLTEHLMLAVAGGVLGIGVALAILRSMASALAAQPAVAARLDATVGVLPVALAATTLACLLFGVAPALRLSRGDVAASLNGVPPAQRIEIAGYGPRDAVVFVEVACAVGLLVWTAMLYTLFAQLRGISFAFPAERVVAMRVPADDAPDVAARVAAIPGITRTAVSSGLLGGGTRVRVKTAAGRTAVVAAIPVGSGFLETLGVALVRGRSFDAGELQSPGGAVILSESAARQLVPGGDALGTRLRVAARGPEAVVVGVCSDAIDYGALAGAGSFVSPEIYVPYEASGPEAVVLARAAATDAHSVMAAVGAAARTPPGARPARPVVLSDDVKDRTGDAEFAAVRLLGAFAVVTLVLAAGGVFAVVSRSVGQRTREFGIQIALGAAPRRVLRTVLARETKLIALAIGTGLAFALGLTRALFMELTTLNAIVPWMWVSALALSGGVAAIACLLATWRIVRLEPSAVLRRT